VRTARFWWDTFERAVKTFAQTLAALLVADGTGLLDSAWGARLSTAGMAAFVALLTSIGSSGVGAADSASLLPADVDPPQDEGDVSLVEAVLVVFLAVVILVLLGVID
jgi:hypothetical protein